MDSPIEPLHALAAAAGVQRHWRDVDGREHVVADATLAIVLAALGYKAGSARQTARSLALLEQEQRCLPALLVADAGQPIALPFACAEASATGKGGTVQALECREGAPLAPAEPGYYDCRIDGAVTRLAVAPPGLPQPPAGPRRRWGVSLQIPSLRGSQASPFGSFGELAEAVEALAAAGADLVAINPVHALASGHGERFSPYFPSSRRFLNGAMADPALLGLPPLPADEGPPLIGWEQALPARLEQFRALYAALPQARRAEIIGTPDEAMRRQAIFDTLDCHFRAAGKDGWRNWPSRYHKPDGKAVAAFAAKHAAEVDFHLFVQALAAAGLAVVRARARAAGMSIGLVGDLAVGVDPDGADSWALGAQMLRGLTIGAPPDPLGPLGQNWGITGFSPAGLRRSGYAEWLAMIRAALAQGGGLRIDHAFGLARLWVIPDGGGPADGAYLAYPFDDLVRLLALEAHLAQAFIIAEDLGTSPHGFLQMITERGMLGMRVLWFERAADNGFIGAADFDPQAVAMTGTHDTPTLAGWWSGRDIDWAAQLGRLPEGTDRAGAHAIRDWDRGLLWSTIAGHTPRPAPQEAAAFVTAAIAHIARTPCALAIVPVEDLLGLVEQPNIPGTIAEHPNWRRRLAAPLAAMLAQEEVRLRLDALQTDPPLSP